MFQNSMVVIRKLDGNQNMGSRWCFAPMGSDINGWVDAISHSRDFSHISYRIIAVKTHTLGERRTVSLGEPSPTLNQGCHLTINQLGASGSQVDLY